MVGICYQYYTHNYMFVDRIVFLLALCQSCFFCLFFLFLRMCPRPPDKYQIGLQCRQSCALLFCLSACFNMRDLRNTKLHSKHWFSLNSAPTQLLCLKCWWKSWSEFNFFTRLAQRPFSAVVPVFYYFGNLPCFKQQHYHSHQIELALVPMGD